MNRIRLSVLSLIVIALASFNLFFSSSVRPSIPYSPTVRPVPAPVVLSATSPLSPVIFISSEEDSYNTGGVISQSVLDEPAISIMSSENTGSVNLDIYQADMQAVLEYLRHDAANNQVHALDYSRLTKINTLTTDLARENDRILLPLTGEGVWLLKIKVKDRENLAFLIRTSMAAVAKEGDNQIIVWVQDLISKKSLAKTEIQLFSLLNEVKTLGKVISDQSGIAKINLGQISPDLAIVTSNGRSALLPINLRYLNGGGRYEEFGTKNRISRYFVFTDRPLYRPGDTVYFKAVIRDDDDARYQVPKGYAAISVYKDWDIKKSFYSQNFSISDSGTVTGQFDIPTTQGTGWFNLSVTIVDPALNTGSEQYLPDEGRVGFQVEHFRKPDYTLNLSAGNLTYITGQNIEATVSGAYFSGQPLSGGQIKYSIYKSGFYEYEFLSENPQLFNSGYYNYGYWGGKNIYSSDATLDNTGTAKISIPTGSDTFRSPTPQIISLETELTDETGNRVSARKNFLVYPGEYSIFRRSSSYSGQTGQPFVFPVLVKSHTNSNIKNVGLTAKITRESWIAQPLAAGQKYPSYVRETQELGSLNAATDQLGQAQFNFTPDQAGRYQLTVEAKDPRGYIISKNFYVWISDIHRPSPSGQSFQEIKIETDKQQYSQTDHINLKIWSEIPDHDYLLTFERARVNRYQVVNLSGQSTTLPLNLEPTDIPNIHITVTGFNDNFIISDTASVTVSPDSKRLRVEIAPETSRYGPGQTAVIDLKVLDADGKPVSTDLAFWAVDKAIFELSDSNLGDIFNKFWSYRYNSTSTSHSLENIIANMAERGGCFLPDTPILMANGRTKPIVEINPGDYILTRPNKLESRLVKAKVVRTHQAIEDGYLIINSSLKLTPSHLLFLNGLWQPAGNIQPGDLLSGQNGQPIIVESVEWLTGQTRVYNLEIEKFHTFIASGIWVHNDKDSGGGRSVFKDTAYWNPSVKTDKNGKARVTFKLPDNLTTWTLAAVAATNDTRVGQATTEILTAKEVYIRPVLPNFIRVGDLAKISALVHNYTDTPQDFEIKLDFPVGKISSDPVIKSVVINPNSLSQVFWDISADRAAPAGTIIFSAKSKLGKNDSVTTNLPVIPFGFEDSNTQIGTGNQTFILDIPTDTDLTQSAVSLNMASNLLGTLPSAMKYLIGYPYGCVEQTTSRFVPALIAKTNLDLFYDAVDTKNLDTIITKSIERLSQLQSADGGWGWWSEGHSQPYITAYVIENLLAAKNSGADVPNSLLDPAKNYLQHFTPGTKSETVFQLYGLSLINTSESLKISDLTDLGPVGLALATLVNSRADSNPDTNGLALLISQAKPSGDSLYWEADPHSPFPSKEASTAMAIKAIISGGGDRELAVKAARYLLSSRRQNYWANTHATAQIIAAITSLYRTGYESNPNYKYSVTVNDKAITSGRVTTAAQVIKPINLDSGHLNSGQNRIVVTLDGTGQLYSLLQARLWRTDETTAPVSNTISLSKTFTNDKGADYSIGVGDTVTVTLNVSGLPSESRYLTFEDQLPSGLIPVNTHLKNENSTGDSYHFYVNREFTQTGIILSSYRGTGSVSYKARAITEGDFKTPPATALLMYQPEVFGRTQSQVIHIDKNSSAPVINQIQDQITAATGRFSWQKLVIFALIITVAVITVPVIIRFIKKKSTPPVPPTPIVPPTASENS